VFWYLFLKDTAVTYLNIATGDTLAMIPLGSYKNPVYDVDMVDGRLYYMKDADTMECHVF
jgi:hypothetical protein